MGSHAHLLLSGAAAGLVEAAHAELDGWEASWSRFRGNSELSRLNAAAGRWTPLSRSTIALVRRAILAWERTGGLFDPTVISALEVAGYRRDFATSLATEPPAPLEPGDRKPALPHGPTPGCAEIELRDDAARLPPGVRLDFGGIGKGYAADLLAIGLVRTGAAGVCVNLGGDLRVAGSPPSGLAWTVAVADETDPTTDVAWLDLAEGAVATSSRLRRRWRRDGHDLHHLIDPRTGAPTTSTVVAATVIAGEAYWAEVLAKAALIAGRESGTALLATEGVAGLLLTDDGVTHPVGPWERFVTCTPRSGGTSPGWAGCWPGGCCPPPPSGVCSPVPPSSAVSTAPTVSRGCTVSSPG